MEEARNDRNFLVGVQKLKLAVLGGRKQKILPSPSFFRELASRARLNGVGVGGGRKNMCFFAKKKKKRGGWGAIMNLQKKGGRVFFFRQNFFFHRLVIILVSHATF